MSQPSFDASIPIALDVLQSIGGLSHLVLAITVLSSKSIQRHPTCINLSCTWVISSISYLFLAFGGGQLSHEPPHAQHCFLSATLVYAAPTLTSFAMLSTILQLWFTVLDVTSHRQQKSSVLRSYLLVSTPYIVWLFTFICSIAMGVTSEGNLRKASSGLYCVIESGVPINIALCTLAMVITIGIGVHTGVKVQQHVGSAGATQLPVGMLVRVVIFALAGIVAIIMNSILMTQTFSPLPIPNVIIALMPIIVFLIFGTRKDVLQVWICRGRKLPYMHTNV